MPNKVRLINADELKEHYEQTISDYAEAGIFPTGFGIEDAIEWTENMPTIDAVPVVRCKDCIYNENSNREGLLFCRCFGQLFPTEFYCAMGAKIGEEE